MRSELLRLFFVLLALLLAACGGGGAETSESPAETAVEAPVSAEAVPTAGDGDRATEAEPAEEPQPAAVPEPTDEPQATEAPEPTIEPRLTEESAATGEGWGESGTTAQSACDHPYFPLRSGSTWTMSGVEGESITWEVVTVEGDLLSATAEMKMSSGDLELNYTWECSADDGLVSFGFGNQGLSTLGPEVEFEVSDGSGMFLPAAEELVPGYTWQSSYQSAYTMTQMDGDLEMEISGNMDTMQTSTVLSDDPVSYSGEEVSAVLIQQDSQMDMVMSMMGSDVESSMSMGGEMVLGWGLGMLRQTSFTDFGDFTMEVTDVYVP